MLTCSLWLIMLRAGLLKGDGQQDAFVAGMPFCWQNKSISRGCRDVFRLSCDEKLMAAPVRLILSPRRATFPQVRFSRSSVTAGDSSSTSRHQTATAGDAAPMEPRNGRHAEQQKQYFEHHVLQRQQKHGQALPLDAWVEPGEQVD